MGNKVLSSDDQDLMRQTILDVFGPDGVDLLEESTEDDPSLELTVRPFHDVISEIDNELFSSSQPPRTLAAIAKVARKRLGESKYIVIQIHQTALALPISQVLEVQRVPRITSIPNVPDWLRGVTNLRGEIISVVDGRTFFQMPANDHAPQRRLVIIQSLQQERWVGLMVDRVIGMRTIDPLEVTPVVPGSGQNAEKFLTSSITVGQETVGIMDLEAFLSSEEMNQFAAA